MISVGLTGGIGSGKSVVADMFKVLNIPVYNSDIEAKNIMETNSEIKTELVKLLGNETYLENKINRPFIASKIFSDLTIRNKLNEIVHKYVFEDYKVWAESNILSKFVLLESAILFETGNAGFNKFNILVVSSKELKFKRLKERGMAEADILQRMSAQWYDEKTIELADYVVYNNENDFISKQVLSIYENIISRINN
ncbi:MAG: dephospho-CoA kinase [Bacteroidia bacterium]|nr:dephospho-CoA kinase [Bacteroidia bacterium]